MSIYLIKQVSDSASVPNAANDAAIKDHGLLRRWMRSAVRRWQRRSMMQALERLDDHMLADIGIHRGGIPRVVRGFDDRELRMVPVAESSRAPKAPCEFRKAA